MIDYRFVTIDELAEAIRQEKKGKYISFTFDDTDDDGFRNPEGWYGVTKSKLFDGTSLLFGYFGGGVLFAYPIEEDEDYVDAISEFYNNESCRYADENTKICVDLNEYVQAKY